MNALGLVLKQECLADDPPAKAGSKRRGTRHGGRSYQSLCSHGQRHFLRDRSPCFSVRCLIPLSQIVILRSAGTETSPIHQENSILCSANASPTIFTCSLANSMRRLLPGH